VNGAVLMINKLPVMLIIITIISLVVTPVKQEKFQSVMMVGSNLLL
jgi:hypothetical protein